MKSLWDKQENLFWILSYLILICVSCRKSYQREIFGLRDSWQKPVEVLLAHVAPVKEEANLGVKGSRCQMDFKGSSQGGEKLPAAFELWWREGEPRSSARSG